jgi:hypothetical protein
MVVVLLMMLPIQFVLKISSVIFKFSAYVSNFISFHPAPRLCTFVASYIQFDYFVFDVQQ